MDTNIEHQNGPQNNDSGPFPNDNERIEFDTHYPVALKMTQDGQIVLSPQPSSDVNDLLNWSQSKKMIILLVVSATAFLPDFGSSMGAVTSVVQSNFGASILF